VGDCGFPPSAVRVFYKAGTSAASLDDISGLELRPGDILDGDAVDSACAGVDYVFHMAGSTSFDPRRKRLQWLINVEGTRRVLDGVRRHPRIRRLCHTSTVNVLGVPDPPGSLGDLDTADPYAANRPRLHSFASAAETLAFVEEARRRPDGPWDHRIGLGYFDSKLAAQELVSDYVQTSGINAVSVLPGTCFGPYDFFVGNGIYLIALYRGRMPAVLGGGFSAAYVMDAAEGFRLAMASGRQGRRYIITGAARDNLYLKDMAAVVVTVLAELFPGKDIRPPKMTLPRWAGLAAATVSEGVSAVLGKPCLLSRAAVMAGSMPLFYSSALAERELGYKPGKTFRQAVTEAAEYYRDRGCFDPGYEVVAK
jgi:dihydroflavonol-4-reductase